MSALSEMLTQANTEGLSIDKITERMHKAGHKIGRDTVWKYMSGRHTTVTTPFLRAFVDVFPSLRLSALERAGEVPPDLGPWAPPREANALDSAERAALDLIIKSMAKSKVVGNVVEMPARAPESHQPVRRAAMEDERRGQRRKRERPGENTDPYIDGA